jgi:hypothetical protein
MKSRNGRTRAVLVAALACTTTAAAATEATAAPTKVKVRVEGNSRTIFEGSVTTDVHEVTGDASGPHKCDGTNGGAPNTPGPTATGALDDATELAGLDWEGSYDASFDDFIVSRIGPDSATSAKFWGVGLNGKPLEIGGCQQVVAAGDEVLWAYDLFSKDHVLLASSARRVRAGRILRVKVKDGKTGDPVAGASIGGKRTNAGGVAKLRFRTRGTKRLKARRADSVRSNQLNVKVLPRR